VQKAFGWPDALIAWLPNTAGIVFVLVTVQSAAIIDVRGARTATLLAAALLMASNLLRAIPLAWLPGRLDGPWEQQAHPWICIASMVLNGMCAPPIALAPPILRC